MKKVIGFILLLPIILIVAIGLILVIYEGGLRLLVPLFFLIIIYCTTYAGIKILLSDDEENKEEP